MYYTMYNIQQSLNQTRQVNTSMCYVLTKDIPIENIDAHQILDQK